MEQVRNVDHSVNDPLNQGQTFLVSSRTFRAFVPRPHGHPEICPERSTADRNHLVDQVKINHGVNNLFMTPDSVTAHGDTCPDLVLEDLWILRYQGSTAIENRLELSTDLPLIAGTPRYAKQPHVRSVLVRTTLPSHNSCVGWKARAGTRQSPVSPPPASTPRPDDPAGTIRQRRLAGYDSSPALLSPAT